LCCVLSFVSCGIESYHHISMHMGILGRVFISLSGYMFAWVRSLPNVAFMQYTTLQLCLKGNTLCLRWKSLLLCYLIWSWQCPADAFNQSSPQAVRFLLKELVSQQPKLQENWFFNQYTIVN
jgi:hypothetical protein